MSLNLGQLGTWGCTILKSDFSKSYMISCCYCLFQTLEELCKLASSGDHTKLHCKSNELAEDDATGSGEQDEAENKNQETAYDSLKTIDVDDIVFSFGKAVQRNKGMSDI